MSKNEKFKEEHEKARKREKKAKRPFLTDMARDVTDIEHLAVRKLQEALQDVKDIKTVDELHSALAQPPWSFAIEEMQQNGRWKSRADLLEMVQAFLSDQEKAMRGKIAKLVGKQPDIPIAAAVSTTTAETTVAGVASEAVAQVAAKPSAESLFERVKAAAKAQLEIDLSVVQTDEELDDVITELEPNMTKLDRLRVRAQWRAALQKQTAPKAASKGKTSPKTTTPPPPLQKLPAQPLTATAAANAVAMATTHTSDGSSAETTSGASIVPELQAETTEKDPTAPKADSQTTNPGETSTPKHCHNTRRRRG